MCPGGSRLTDMPSMTGSRNGTAPSRINGFPNTLWTPSAWTMHEHQQWLDISKLVFSRGRHENSEGRLKNDEKEVSGYRTQPQVLPLWSDLRL